MLHEIISRADAKRAGMTRYFTGAQCARGHIALRFVHNYECITCKYNRYSDKPTRELPACVICEMPVRNHGHVTCSTRCRDVWRNTKERARYSLGYKYERKFNTCPTCGVYHQTRYQRYCSDSCRSKNRHKRDKRYNINPHTFRYEITCEICGAQFHSRSHQHTCRSRECLIARHRKYRREMKRLTDAKLAAVIGLARTMGVLTDNVPRQARQRKSNRPCRICGKALTVRRRVYCGDDCSYIGTSDRNAAYHRKVQVERLCRVCGSQIPTGSRKHTLCSLQCSKIARSNNTRQYKLDHPRSGRVKKPRTPEEKIVRRARERARRELRSALLSAFVISRLAPNRMENVNE